MILLAACATEESALKFCQDNGLLVKLSGECIQIFGSRAVACLSEDKRLVIEKVAVI